MAKVVWAARKNVAGRVFGGPASVCWVIGLTFIGDGGLHLVHPLNLA